MLGEEVLVRPTLSRRRSATRIADAICVGAAVFVLAAASLLFTQKSGGVATVWPANAIALAFMLRSPRRSWRGLLAATLIGNLAADLVGGDSLAESLAFACCDGLEVGLCAAFLEWSTGEAFDLHQQKHLILFLVACAVIGPGIGGLPASAAMVALRGSRFGLSLFRWWWPDALGLLIVTPCLISVTSEGLSELGRRLASPRGALAAAVLATALLVVNLQTRLPLLFLIPAALVFTAFELGVTGAATALLLSAGVAVAASVAGFGPTVLVRGELDLRLMVLQGFLLTLTISILPVATAVARRRRLQAEQQANLRALEAARAETAKAHAHSLLAEQAAGIGYWRRDLSTGEIVWSDQMYVIHGLAKAAHAHRIGEEIGLYAPEDRSKIREVVRNAIATGSPFDLKARLTRASDRAARIVAFKGGVERDASGTITAVFGVTRDITEEETARERLEESEARYRLLADSTTDLVTKIDRAGLFDYVSPSFRRYGYEPDRLIGRPAFDIVHPDDLPRVTALFEKAFATGDLGPAANGLYRMLAADGHAVWVEGGPTLIRNDAGEVIAGISHLRDVTERVEAEAARAEVEARYRLLADASADIVIKYGPDGILRYISPSIARYGYDPEALVGTPVTSLVHADEVGRLQASAALLFAPGGDLDPHRNRTYRLRTASGEHVWVEANPTVVYEADGSPRSIISHVRDITERVAATQALADSEARYRLLADASTDIVLTNDIHGIIRYASPSVRRYGHDPEALVGVSAREVVHPEDYSRVLKSVQAQMAGEPFDPTWDRTYRFKTGDGGHIWVEGAASVVRDEAGDFVEVVSQLRDVSQRHEAIEALADSEARYRLLADSSTDVVIKIDAGDHIEYVSPSARRYGYDPEALIGVSGFTLVHPDDLPKLQAIIQDLFTTGMVDPARDRTYRLRTTDGAFVWMEGSPTIVRDEAGAPVAVVSQLRDVSERMAAMRALEESEMRHRIIAENATDIVSRTDRRGRFLYLSPSVTEVMGYAPDELLGEAFLPYMHPEDIPTVEAYYRALAENGPRIDQALRYRARRKNGQWVWLECHPTVLRDAGGRPREYIDVTRDITRSVRLEAELMAARDAAEKAATVKAAFVANMSHEIRTPLTAILGFANLLARRADLDEDARGQVGHIGGAGRALLSIVNDVLDFSKLDAGQFEIRAHPIAPVEVMNEALALFTPQAEAKGLALNFRAAAGLPALLRLDPDRLRQILLNLIGNAVKFTEEGSVTLEAAYEAEGEVLEIRVQDTGCGMSRAQQRKLFLRFSQVDGSARSGGTGLGLAICKGLAEAMGGGIGVTSQPGRGSEFRVRVKAPLVTPGDEAAAEAPISIEGLRLLLVDDNPTNRELARAILTPFGVEVTEAGDGLAAIAAAKAHPFDAILMDIRMPRLGGPAAAARIRAEEGPNRDVPILAFSADAELTEEGDGFTFDGVVRKPLSPTDLIAGLQRCV